MNVTDEEVRSALNAILQSRHFARSQRCCQFLRYVCELALSGDSSNINEHRIGIEVFGRGADYSPAEDAIVRRQAYALRYKLDEYYNREGRDDEIRIALPTGHYVPVFHRRSLTHGGSANGAAVPLPTLLHTGRWLSSPPPATALLGLVLVAAVGVWLLLGTQTQVSATGSTAEISMATRDFWGPWLADENGPLICLSNPMTTRVRKVEYEVAQQSLGRNFTVDAAAEAGIRQWFRLGSDGFVYLLPSISQAKMGDALAAALIANLLGRAGVRARLTQSRFLSWENLRSENIILLGHPETNPWIEPVLQDRPFQMLSSTGHEPARIVNLQPEAGESAIYYLSQPDEEGPSFEYALISLLRSENKPNHVLVIAGLTSQATQVAGELLTDPSKLDEVTRRLALAGATPDKTLSFQMVVKTSVRDKTPTGWGEIVAMRVL